MGASRDDILAAWGVPPTQIGVALAAGLNSGEARNYDEAVLWQGAVAHRLEGFREGLQQYLDIWEPVVGFRPSVVFETPSFDDNAPLYEQAQHAKFIPLTHQERRAIVGLDPFGDPALDGQVYLDQTMIPLLAGPQQSTAIETGTTETASKASLTETLRTRTERQFLPTFTKRVAAVLAEMRDAIASAVEAKWDAISRKPTDPSPWWKAPRWELDYGALARQVSRAASGRVETGKASVDADVVEAVVRSGAARITAINDVTRQAIRDIIVRGVADGLGPSQVAQNIRDAGVFSDSRSEMIARTETMLAYNEAALGTYRNLDVEYVEALDGDQDDVCAARVARNPWPIGDAYSEQDHPNGTLDWAPILSTKATVEESDVKPEDLAAIQRTITDALGAFGKAGPMFPQSSPVTINLPSKLDFEGIEIPPAQINIPAPEITVNVPRQEPPHVTVNVPEQAAPVVNVEAPGPAKATGPQEVVVTSLPQRRHSVVRDKKGAVLGSIEDDAQ